MGNHIKRKRKGAIKMIDKTGYEYVTSISKSFVVYEIYRKIENGKGKWIAEDCETGEVFRITYDQALGYEPIRPTPIENLARELGRKLLPSYYH